MRRLGGAGPRARGEASARSRGSGAPDRGTDPGRDLDPGRDPDPDPDPDLDLDPDLDPSPLAPYPRTVLWLLAWRASFFPGYSKTARPS